MEVFDGPISDIEGAALGQLMTAQTVLNVLPSSAKIAEFVVSVLELVPAIAACSVCIRGHPEPFGSLKADCCNGCCELAQSPDQMEPCVCLLKKSERTLSFSLATGCSRFGRVIIVAESLERFASFEPFVGNFANIVAITIENRWHKKLLKAANDELVRANKVAEAVNEVLEGTLTCETEEDLGKKCLSVAERLTESKFGFIGQVNPAGLVDTLAISDLGWNACAMATDDATRQIKNMPIRGIGRSTIRDEKSRIVNGDQMATHADRVGHPDGHPKITAFLGVPLKRNGKTIGMIGLGNKDGGYDLADQSALETVSVAVVEALFRKQSQLEVNRHREHLADLVDERTVRLRQSNEQLQREIVERRKAEEEVRIFKTIADKAAYGFGMCDVEGNIIYINDSYAGMHGREVGDVTGKPLSIFHSKGQMEDIQRLLSKLKAAGAVTAEEVWHTKADGTSFPTLMSLELINDDGGNPLLLGITAIDITERKRAHAELKQHQAELAHTWRVNTMGEMASGLAHELNQPLCAILNYSSACARIMENQPDESGEMTNALDEISDQADRAGQIIRRLRALITKGEPRESTVHINDVVEEVLEIENAEAFDKSIIIRKELGEGLPTVIADPIQIEQVVLNIIRNAFDAMANISPEKRQVTIRTSVGEGNSIKVAVSDTGIGLLSDIAARLFDPFFTTKANGLGVGLSLSRSIIDAHGGRLWAESNPDGGATFSFTLPVKCKKSDTSTVLAQRQGAQQD